jgi:hypothetical protein
MKKLRRRVRLIEIMLVAMVFSARGERLIQPTTPSDHATNTRTRF